MRNDSNSVQQINKECTKMLEIARDMHYVDTDIMSAGLESALKAMIDTFNEHPEDRLLVLNKKLEVERLAISLEYYIQARSSHFRERYAMRKFASRLYNDVKKVSYAHMKKLEPTGSTIKESDSPNVKHLIWTSYLSFARTFSLRALHVNFNVYPEDDQMIMLITQALKEENNYG